MPSSLLPLLVVVRGLVSFDSDHSGGMALHSFFLQVSFLLYPRSSPFEVIGAWKEWLFCDLANLLGLGTSPLGVEMMQGRVGVWQYRLQEGEDSYGIRLGSS
ncbi:hypothetical protein BDV18DRAFT_138452 [Aspergillus unguis]